MLLSGIRGKTQCIFCYFLDFYNKEIIRYYIFFNITNRMRGKRYK